MVTDKQTNRGTNWLTQVVLNKMSLSKSTDNWAAASSALWRIHFPLAAGDDALLTS